VIFNSTCARLYHVEAHAPSHEPGNKLGFTSAAEQGPAVLSEGGGGGGLHHEEEVVVDSTDNQEVGEEEESDEATTRRMMMRRRRTYSKRDLQKLLI
jgi:hypothetical protein